VAEKGADNLGQLEQDADVAAASAVARIWGRANGLPGGDARSIGTSLASGLALRRCGKECPAGIRQVDCSKGMKTVSIDLVQLRGSGRNPTEDLAVANLVYRQCCVQLAAGYNQRVPDDFSDSVLGAGKTDLTVSPLCGSVDPMEKKLYDDAATKFKLSSRIRAFYVSTYSGYTSLAYSITQKCATGTAAPYANHTVIQDKALKDTLAHEVGHILMNSEEHHGIDNPGDSENVMLSPGRVGCAVDESQCKKIQSSV